MNLTRFSLRLSYSHCSFNLLVKWNTGLQSNGPYNEHISCNVNWETLYTQCLFKLMKAVNREMP